MSDAAARWPCIGPRVAECPNLDELLASADFGPIDDSITDEVGIVGFPTGFTLRNSRLLLRQVSVFFLYEQRLDILGQAQIKDLEWQSSPS